jgi:hypothetical protein
MKEVRALFDSVDDEVDDADEKEIALAPRGMVLELKAMTGQRLKCVRR